VHLENTQQEDPMTQTAAQPFTGAFDAQPTASTFAFAIRHSGTFWFRGALTDVAARLRDEDGQLVLEGSAGVDSISVEEPAAMRASLLGPEFFDAERHPRIDFHSTEIRLDEDGELELEGELTIRGVSRPVHASGRYSAPRVSSFGEIAGSSWRPASTAASSASTGRWSCRTVATRSAGRSGSRSTCS
jgi:polyisoprenoid-binding protein YceI